ncbi:CbiQ family ECF transporter T component [Falsirhodobacter algicola]|uniref:Energy-coupling factor transporter transmembrane protein EcfT n=1 Tax=Falsirhodobacter algicola TaxID=2692330 RepID=A0A8J8SLR1_9RHOB|nr:CbiQ family ECF transporter T component [Falsirhodobacter algicola]QUS36689.1 energy-coupling factor transporter transmembrane protein EcfT [Falsirhodobacter algicola]
MIALTSPIRTPWHRIPPAPKLVALVVLTAGVLALERPLPLALLLAGVAGGYAAGGRAFMAEGARVMRPLLPLILVLAAWHLVLRAPEAGAVLILRILAAVGAANLVTMTTRLDAMIALVTRLARPLAPVLPPKALALAIALMIRFIPVAAARHAAARDAWRARSPSRPGWRTVPAVLLGTLDDADHVAEALRARGGMS